MTERALEIRQAYGATIADKGYTHIMGTQSLPSKINPSVGYVIGGLWKETIMERNTRGEFDFVEFSEAWGRYASFIKNYPMNNIGIGTWIHLDKIYFDIVEYSGSLEYAMQSAKAREEIAIWDCENQKEIPVTTETIEA